MRLFNAASGLSSPRRLAIAADVVRGSAFYARDRMLGARLDRHHASHLRFADHKRSDTLFILGSGGSIAHTTAAQWERIQSCDSLGFNNWLVHEHVPTYYALEMPAPSVPARELTEANTRHNLRIAAPRYAGVPMLLAFDRSSPIGLDYVPDSLLPHTYLVPMQLMSGSNLPEVEFALETHLALGHLRARSHYVRSLKKRASVFRHVYFGLLAGYRRIVLAGVDLNNTAYFFDGDRDAYHARGYRLNHVAFQQTGAVHRTNDAREGELTVSVLLDVLDRVALQPAGVHLNVLHPSTALHPRFPLLDT